MSTETTVQRQPREPYITIGVSRSQAGELTYTYGMNGSMDPRKVSLFSVSEQAAHRMLYNDWLWTLSDPYTQQEKGDRIVLITVENDRRYCGYNLDQPVSNLEISAIAEHLSHSEELYNLNRCIKEAHSAWAVALDLQHVVAFPVNPYQERIPIGTAKVLLKACKLTLTTWEFLREDSSCEEAISSLFSLLISDEVQTRPEIAVVAKEVVRLLLVDSPVLEALSYEQARKQDPRKMHESKSELLRILKLLQSGAQSLLELAEK